MGLESLTKYLSSIYGNKKPSTEHRAIQKPKSITENSQSYLTGSFSSIVNEFGYYSGQIVYADSMARYYFPTTTTASIPLIASPITGGTFPVNMLDNYGFERGGVSPGLTAPGKSWTTSGTGTFAFDTDVKSGAEGVRSLSVTWNATTWTCDQDILNITDWGKALRVVLDSKTVSGAANGWKIVITAKDASGSSLGTLLSTSTQGTSNNTWTNYVFTTSTIPSNTYKITFSIQGQNVASTVTRFDNIYLNLYPRLPIPLFFGQDIPLHESYQVGAVRAFDLFNRVSSTDIGVASDFKNWRTSSGTVWATDILFNSFLEEYFYANVVTKNGSNDLAVFNVGDSGPLMAYAIVQIPSGASAGTVLPGLVLRCNSDLSSYVFVRFNGAPGSTTLRITDSLGTNIANSSSFTTTAGNSYLIVAVVDSGSNITAYCIGGDQSTVPSVTWGGDGRFSQTYFGIGTSSTGTPKFIQYAVADVMWGGSSNIVYDSAFNENTIKSTSGSASIVNIDLHGPPNRVQYRIGIDTLPTSSDEAGIIFRYRDDLNYWRFISTSSAYKVIPVVNGIEGNSIVTDTKVPSTTNHYVYSDLTGFSIVTSDTYFEEVLSDTPLAYYRLGEATGTSVKDYSGNNQDGTISGSVSMAQSSALSTDGTTSILVNTTNPSTARIFSTVEHLPGGALQRSLEAWINPHTSGSLTYGDVCGYPYNTGSEANQFSITFNVSGTFKCRVHYGTGLYLNSVTNFSADAGFNHVVATYDGSTIRLYINGVLDNSVGSVTLATAVNNTGTSSFNIMGSPVQASSSQRESYIQDVAIYDRCLSAGRVAAHYNAGKSHMLLMSGKTRFDSEYLSDRTGFGIYIKGTSPRLIHPMVNHLDIDPVYKDLGHYSSDKRVV